MLALQTEDPCIASMSIRYGRHLPPSQTVFQMTTALALDIVTQTIFGVSEEVATSVRELI